MTKTLREAALLLAALGLALPAAALAKNDSGTGAAGAGGKPLSKDLQEGIEKLHAGDQAEVQMGKLGQQSGVSPDVKSFGEKMATDHSQNDQQLASLAQTLGVSLEGKTFAKAQKDAQKRMGSVEKKTGADFDKAYMKDMVKDHEKDAKDVKKLAEKARKEGQTDLASFLDQTEQTMQGHLTQAKQVEAAVKKEKKTASSSSSSGTGAGSADTSGAGAAGTSGTSGHKGM